MNTPVPIGASDPFGAPILFTFSHLNLIEWEDEE